MKQTPCQLNNQQGIALILAVLILANLFIIAFIVSDIVIRIGKSSHQIGYSEIAYLAAETAVEKTIYSIESDRDLTSLGTEASPVTGQLEFVDAEWLSYVTPITQTGVICIDNNQKFSFPAVDPDDGVHSCIYSDAPSADIDNTNPLRVHLQAGKTFYLELDIDGIDYPNFLDLSWQNKRPGQVIILNLDETGEDIQTIVDTNDVKQAQVPPTGSLSANQRFDIRNEHSSDIIYTITPSLGDYALTLSIMVYNQGQYSTSQERIIEVERRNWQIY